MILNDVLKAILLIVEDMVSTMPDISILSYTFLRNSTVILSSLSMANF